MARAPEALIGGVLMGARPLQTYGGSCHCQAIQFEIDTDCPELTTCDCSICRRKNALMIKVHERAFRLLAGQESLVTYQFHTRTAEHYFCRTCGIYPYPPQARHTRSFRRQRVLPG